MPLGCLFVGVGDVQKGLFAEGLADNLHPDGQAIPEARREGDGGDARDIDGQGADIAQVHLEGVVRLLPNLEGDSGRGGRHQRVVLLEGGVKLAPDKGAHFLRLHVIGIIVAGR